MGLGGTHTPTSTCHPDATKARHGTTGPRGQLWGQTLVLLWVPPPPPTHPPRTGCRGAWGDTAGTQCHCGGGAHTHPGGLPKQHAAPNPSHRHQSHQEPQHPTHPTPHNHTRGLRWGPPGDRDPFPDGPAGGSGAPPGGPPPKASSTQISPGALPWALRRGQGEPPGWGPARLGSARLRLGSGSAPGGGRAPPPAPRLAPPGSARPRCPAGSCSPGGESRATKRGLAAIWALNGIKKYPPHPL